MNIIYDFLPEHILNALGWTVLHSLWQAFLIALLLAAYLLVWQKTDARRRYLAGCVAMGSTLLFSIITFFVLLENGDAGSILVSEVVSAEGEVPGHYFIENDPLAFAGYFNENMPLIVAAWLMGMVFFLLKTLGGLLYIQRLKTRHLSDVPRQWQAALSSLQASLGISSKIKIAASALVKVPMVVGWLRPVVLMPVAAINNLTTAQVEAVLAHELAHIARYDYLVNILQAAVEAMFYFNPAVWWISSRIRTERENCCDDLAVATCGNSVAYAKALVSLQEMHQARPILALSFSKNKNQLLTRIQRILQSPDKKSNAMEKISATVLLLAAVVLLSLQAQSSFKNSTEIGKDSFLNSEPSPKLMPHDTIPDDLKLHGDENIVITKKNGDVIKMKLDNGQIKDVRVNGEQVPEEEFAAYDLQRLSPDEVATIDVSKNNNGDIGEYPPGNIRINKSIDGEGVELKLKDGKVTYLEIDGEVIDEADYPNHEALIDDLVNNIPPPPPAPPIPPMPVFPGHGHTPVAPAPPSAVPAPPAPPVPPARTRTITTEKNGKGMTIIIENGTGEEPVEIEIENHRKGDVIINGNEIKGLKDGDRTVIKEKIEGDGTNRFFYDEANDRTFWFPNNPEIADIPFPEVPAPEIADIFERNNAFVFPDNDEELAQRYHELLAKREAKNQELFERLELKQAQQKEYSEKLMRELRENQENLFNKQMQRAEELQLERKQLLEELKQRKKQNLFENDQRMLLRDKQLLELNEKLLAEQKAVEELMSKRDFETLAKRLKQMKELQEEVNRLDYNTSLLRYKEALINDYENAQ